MSKNNLIKLVAVDKGNILFFINFCACRVIVYLIKKNQQIGG